MPRVFRVPFPIALLVLVLAPGLWGCQPVPPSAPAPAPVPVVLYPIAPQPLEVAVEEVGWAEASNSATLLPRVGGQILRRHFEEGQAVAAGGLLYTVDPAPFEAKLRSAEAQLERTRAELKYAQDEADRYVDLKSKNTVSRSTADQFINAALVLQQMIRVQEAELEQARLNLDYCRVLSPIPGRAGAYLANEGAFVEAYRTPLVVVNRIDPIDLVFALPEARLPEVLDTLAAGRLEVTGRIVASGRARAGGVVHFIDNAVDPATGTIRLKARFANPDAFFWPGQFVRVRLVLRTIPDALLVPAESVVTGPLGPSVFVAASGKAELRPVRTAETLEGRTRLLAGVTPGETVVVEGQNKLKPGVPLKATAR